MNNFARHDRRYEPVPDIFQAIVARELANGSFRLRPRARRKSRPLWARCLIAAFFLSLHAALGACGYYFIYGPWWASLQARPAVGKDHPASGLPRPSPKP